MRFRLKVYPTKLPSGVKVSQIRSKKMEVETPDDVSEAEARRHIIDDLHEQGMFIKKITKEESYA